MRVLQGRTREDRWATTATSKSIRLVTRAYDPEQLKLDAANLIKRTRTDKGLPATIENPEILRRIAVLMRRPKERAS